MGILGVSFLAGILTVLAPCVLPLLPVIIGGSVIDGKKSRPWIIITSFAVSVLLFTIILKILFDSFGISREQVAFISAIILVVFGIFFLFPSLRQKMMAITGIEHKTAKAQQSTGGKGVRGDIALGAVLGPVFNTCSPTYGLILSTILPASFARGVVNILVYTLGLVIILSVISYGGRAAVKKLKRAAKPDGRFRRIIAILIILVGVSMIFKRDKAAEAWLFENNLVIDTTQRELNQTEQFR